MLGGPPHEAIAREHGQRGADDEQGFSGILEGGNLRRIFTTLGLFAELELVHPSVFFEADRAEGGWVLPNDYPTCKERLFSRFPHEREGLTRFFEELEVHGQNGYYQFQIIAGQVFPDVKQLRYARKYLSRITVSEAMDERIRDPFLRQLLIAPCIYVGGVEEDLGYLYYLHVLYATLICGNAYVKGTSQRLSNVLVSRIRKAGGAVVLRTEVTGILVDDLRRAYGVETSRGRFFSDRVYINASPHYALQELFPPLPALETVREKLRALKPSWSTTTLYLATDRPPEELGLEHSETMFFSDRALEARTLRQAARTPEEIETALWEASTMEVTNYHKLDPATGNVVCLNVLDRLAHWPAYGTPAYQAKKERALAALLGRFLRRKPRFRGHILHEELSTPHTYRRYTYNFDGAGYGALVGTDASAHLFHYNFPLGGVRFLSAWVAGPSYEAAFGYAEVQARQMLEERRAAAAPVEG